MIRIKYIYSIFTILLILGFINSFSPNPIYADLGTCERTTPPCYNWNNATDLGCYLNCALPALWNTAKKVIVAITILLTLWMIVKTVISVGSANSQEIQQLPMKWVYVILLGFVAVGAVGTIINILAQFFGFGNLQTIGLNYINQVLDAIHTIGIGGAPE